MKAKRIIRVIAFVLIFVALALLFANIVQVNSARDVIGIYGLNKEDENSIDVAVIGSSQIYTSYYPALAYKEYGFTSYSVSTSAMPGCVCTTALKEMRERQNPQVYFIELSGFFYYDQTYQPVLRKYLDNIPTYADYRIEAIKKLVPEEDRDSFYFPFIKYHNNLVNIKSCVQTFKEKIKISKRGYSLYKNFASTPGIYDTTKEKRAKAKTRLTDASLGYLQETIDYLHDNDIKNVVFVLYPDRFERKYKKSFFKAIDMIEDAGFVYEDWYKDSAQKKIGINPKTDYYNLGHLNIRGAEKITKYIGKYVTEHYDLDTNHSEKVIKNWDDCASYVDKTIDVLTKKLKKIALDDDKVGQCYFEEDMLTIKKEIK